jgi:hypothetical protein
MKIIITESQLNNLQDNLSLQEPVIYVEKREKKGRPFIDPKGTFHCWVYDIPDAYEKMKSGEIDAVIMPKNEKLLDAQLPNYKGFEHLIGMMKGFYDENEQTIRIFAMRFFQKENESDVLNHMVDALQKKFNVANDNIMFKGLEDSDKNL